MREVKQEKKGIGEERETMKTGPEDALSVNQSTFFAADGNPLRNQQRGKR